MPDADWLAAYVLRMLFVRDVNEMALWSCRGARMQNGVRSADAVLIKPERLF